MPVLRCRGWEITTVEGLGSCKEGLNQVQRRVAEHNGTQCGFCTPGMIMTMDAYVMIAIQYYQTKFAYKNPIIAFQFVE